MNFHPGDLVVLPAGPPVRGKACKRLGTVQPAPWVMPFHTLVKVEGDTKPYWIPTELLSHGQS